MERHLDCDTCCTALSISGPISDMPDGKPANAPCAQLDESLCCRIFTSLLRPKVYGGLQPSVEICGWTTHQVMVYLTEPEALTAP